MTRQRPPLRPFSRGSVRAQTASEAASFDERAIDRVGIPQPVLMENAGRSTALIVRELFGGSGAAASEAEGARHQGASARERRTAVALVGSGNNGGDALVALRSLAAWGWSCRAVLAADRADDDPLLHGWPLPVSSDQDLDDDALDALLRAADVVLDGILGTGVRGAPRARQARVIERLNASGRPVVALDVPSGVDASTGAVPGVAVEATVTVSFGAPKLGALLHPARARVGRHVTVEIGFPPLEEADASAFLATPGWVAARRPRRDTDTHKNRVGRVVVVGGGVGMAGAVILTARAAFRGGAGLVQIASVEANRESIHAALPEAIFVDSADAGALDAALAEADAVAAGPGLGTDEAAAEVLRRVVGEGDVPILLDADALNLAAAGAVDLAAVALERAVLITPHPGEMRRILGNASGGGGEEGERSDDDDPASRAETARAACERFGCAVLFKGAPSVVASPDGPMAVDTQSSSDLAVAGMGDTLTGVCAALMAQALEPATAGAVGLYLTGRAAALADRGAGLIPSDVARKIPDALAELRGGPVRWGEGATGEPVMAPSGESDLDLPFVIFDADPAR